MENIFKKILQVRDTVHLKPEEHDRMDKNVLSFIDSHPIQDAKHSYRMEMNSVLAAHSHFFGWGRKLAYAALLVIIVLGVGGGTVYASQNALPGDLLYPIKTNVAEEIQSALKYSDKGKAEWAIERIHNRLEEVEQLTNMDGSVKAEVVAGAEARVAEYSQDVVNATASLKNKNQLEAVSELVAELNSLSISFHAKIGDLSGGNGGGNTEALTGIVEKLVAVENEAKKVQYQLYASAPMQEENRVTVPSRLSSKQLQILSPAQGSTMNIGDFYSIQWAPIDHVKNVEVELVAHATPTDVEHSVGLIHGQQLLQVTTMPTLHKLLWEGGRYYDVHNDMEIVMASPGVYDISFEIETWTGEYYSGEIHDITLRAKGEGSRGVDTTVATPPLVKEVLTEVPHTQPTEPRVEVTIYDVAPQSIVAAEAAGSTIIFAKADITPNKDIQFMDAVLGCSGDTRAVGPIFVSDTESYSIMPGVTPTYGGFTADIRPYSFNVPYIIHKGQTKTIVVQMGIKDPSWALDKGPDSVRISCGFRDIHFKDVATGENIQYNQYVVLNKVEGLRAMKMNVVLN